LMRMQSRVRSSLHGAIISIALTWALPEAIDDISANCGERNSK